MHSDSPAVAGAVLAAGAGLRMGGPKAELVLGGVRLVDRAVAALASGGCTPVYAVVRAGTAVPSARVVVNPAPDRGLRSSLQLAVEAVGQQVDGLAVLLADLPGIGADAVAAALQRWRPGRIVMSEVAGKRGHPIVMSPQLWLQAVELAAAEEGARALLALRLDLVDIVVVHGDAADLDTPEDLARWTRRSELS